MRASCFVEVPNNAYFFAVGLRTYLDEGTWNVSAKAPPFFVFMLGQTTCTVLGCKFATSFNFFFSKAKKVGRDDWMFHGKRSVFCRNRPSLVFVACSMSFCCCPRVRRRSSLRVDGLEMFSCLVPTFAVVLEEVIQRYKQVVTTLKCCSARWRSAAVHYRCKRACDAGRTRGSLPSYRRRL